MIRALGASGTILALACLGLTSCIGPEGLPAIDGGAGAGGSAGWAGSGGGGQAGSSGAGGSGAAGGSSGGGCNPVVPASTAGYIQCGPGLNCVPSGPSVGLATCCSSAGTAASGALCTGNCDCLPGMGCAPGGHCTQWCFGTTDCATGYCNLQFSIYAGSQNVGMCYP